MVDVVDRSSTIEEEELRAGLPSRSRFTLLQVVLLLALILAPPALIRPSAEGKLHFDQTLLREFQDTDPRYVFIGNSMLKSRIDEPTLEKHFGDDCCFILWTGGAESAWMYEALKNVALAGLHPPKTVFMFFRDTYLTQPAYRATDRYWWKIERLSHDEEPELDRAMEASRTWQEALEYHLSEVYPVEKVRDRAGAAVSWVAGEIVTPGRLKAGESAGDRYNSLFDLENLRVVTADDTAFGEEDQSEFDFDGRVETSLLPAMIEVAKKAGVALVFVRVQRRPTLKGPPMQTPQLTSYIQKLRHYVTSHGAVFYDFQGDPQLTLNRYLDGDHIDPAWKPQSTELFLERLHAYIP